MHEVKRAIIMAAGFGSRMRPVTNFVPKPMIDVNGTRIIETVINGLLANNITEIYIVTGYLKEQFEALKNKYPMITLIENPYFETCNNISSLYVVREHLEDAIIIDGDQYIFNEEILSPYFEMSGYNAVWTDGYTEEWLMQTDENGIVKSCSRTGGTKGWQLFGISRWTAMDGRQLKKDVEWEFTINKNTQIYWDDIAMFCHPERYQMKVFEMKKADIIEIDTIKELAAIDKKYAEYVMEE